ncbi:MAG TPA: hypothetical protein VF401_00460 [Candidatus Saccharimonadales bacterium]
MKRLFYFSVGVLMALILLWFGSKFLFWPNDRLNDTELFVSGALLVLGGIGLFSVADLKKNWIPGGVLLLVGLYCFARAAGIIELPWLARVIGVGSWVAGFMLLYITWPTRKHSLDAPDKM